MQSGTVRQSNIELLRIVAMWLVLTLHANSATLGASAIDLIRLNPLAVWSRSMTQAISICCVDVFVLISGWFGIKPCLKSFASFIFQVLFFLVGIYLICNILSITPFSVGGFMANFLFVQDWDYWFIKCYILLYILSPVLNSFVEHTNEKIFRFFLIAFFLYVFIYDWCYISVKGLESGYSTMFMIGLYLLARYCKTYQHKLFNLSLRQDILIIGSCYTVMILLSTIPYYWGNSQVAGKIQGTYVSPFVVFSSLYMVILFSKLKIQSKIINGIAASCFAVYLFHTHICIFPYYKGWISYCYKTYNSPVSIMLIAIFMLFVYIFAILLDKVRIMSWKNICKIHILKKYLQ